MGPAYVPVGRDELRHPRVGYCCAAPGMSSSTPSRRAIPRAPGSVCGEVQRPAGGPGWISACAGVGEDGAPGAGGVRHGRMRPPPGSGRRAEARAQPPVGGKPPQCEGQRVFLVERIERHHRRRLVREAAAGPPRLRVERGPAGRCFRFQHDDGPGGGHRRNRRHGRLAARGPLDDHHHVAVGDDARRLTVPGCPDLPCRPLSGQRSEAIAGSLAAVVENADPQGSPGAGRRRCRLSHAQRHHAQLQSRVLLAQLRCEDRVEHYCQPRRE